MHSESTVTGLVMRLGTEDITVGVLRKIENSDLSYACPVVFASVVSVTRASYSLRDSKLFYAPVWDLIMIYLLNEYILQARS